MKTLVSSKLNCNTLSDLFERNKHLSDRGTIFVQGTNLEQFVSYAELYEDVLKTLGTLQKEGIPTGSEIVFQVDDNRQFITLFWACILGKLIPTPLAVGNQKGHKEKFLKVWDCLDNPYLIGDEKNINQILQFVSDEANGSVFSIIEDRTYDINEILRGDSFGTPLPIEPEDIAFIQFSSGSTGDPKGVIIKHSNAVAHAEALTNSAENTTDDVAISWMPLSHDMGLICIYLKNFTAQMNLCLIPTPLFIRRPLLWIDKASEYKATELFSPNFGFQYCMSAIREGESYNWDLSRVRMIYNGAEPISKQLCDEFAEKFSVFNLHQHAIMPVYGLAEATVGVTSSRFLEEIVSYTVDRNQINPGDEIKIIEDPDDPEQITFVDVGYMLDRCQSRICDDQDQPLADKVIGHIQITGDNVTSGYYNNPIATQQLFTADGWVRTGDLGFRVKDRLVITGRQKNIIIINGQNFYPQDIEQTVIDRIPEIELGKIVAISAPDEANKEEKLVILVLFKKPVAQFCLLVEKIKEIIFDRLRIVVDSVIPIRKVPKTTSGKVQHFQLRQQFLAGEFDQVLAEIDAFFNDENDLVDVKRMRVKDRILEMLKQILSLKEIDPNEDLFELGVNSMVATKLIAQIKKEFGVELSLHELFGNAEFETFNTKSIADFVSEQNASEIVEIPVLPPADYYEVSHAQKRLWLLESYNEGQHPSSIPIRMVFRSRFDLDIYQKTWDILVQRHESLRTVFVMEQQELTQKILPVASIGAHIEFIDARGEEDPERFLELKSYQEARFIFDLENGPLFKLQVIQMADNEFHCLISIHHIVSDGWSTGILLMEINQIYSALQEEKPVQLVEPAIHYKDFAVWKNKELSARSEEYSTFWKNYLAGDLPVLDFPMFADRPSVQTFDGERLTFKFSKATYAGLSKLGNEKDATQFMTLISVLNLLFYKYTGSKDIILGTSVADRSHPDIQQMVGYFLNVIALRTSFDDSGSFLQLLENTRQSILQAYEHQDYPFEKVVQDLEIERNPSRSPIFDVVVLLHNYDHSIIPPNETVTDSEERIVYETDNRTAIVDLFFEFMEYKGQLFLNLRYNTQLFKEEQINAFIGHFESLMNAVWTNPKMSLGQYQIVGPDEKAALDEFHQERAKPVDEQTFVELFEQNAKHFHDKRAVTFKNNKLTYEALNTRANQLANYLRSEIGIEKGALVAVIMPRSDQYLETILAIWKAGATYLPISHKNPFNRAMDIIKDANVKAVITDAGVFGDDQVQMMEEYAKVVSLDQSRDQIVRSSSENPAVSINPAGLAYIIYTSGSTGKPKGVMVEHQGMVNHLRAKIEDLTLDQDSIVSQNASQDFDISIWQFVVALMTGGQTIVYDDQLILDPERFIDTVENDQVTILEVVPSYLHVVLSLQYSRAKANSLPALQYMIVTGEVLNASLVTRWFQQFPSIKMMNAYGPTEASDDITHYIMDTDPGLARIPIGTAVRNMSIYIVDEHMQLCPKGVKGEICVSGIGVGKGYFNDEEKTNLAFVKNPFAGKKGYKLYKTGDIGRYLPDGSIEFFGRKDQQVKIHGHRIELGEIENRLMAIDKISLATVIVNESDLGEDQFLTAFIVFRKGEHITDSIIQQQLADELPEYMVPQIVIALDELPLTPNGKIDRKKLSEIGTENIQDDSVTQKSLPKTETERQLLEIWQSVLQVADEIGTNENFFRIGGYSLLANQVSIRVQQHFGVKLEMKQLFLFPTIRQLADEIDKGDKAIYQSIPTVEERSHYELSHAQRRLWILYQMEEKQTAYNVYGAYTFPKDTDVNLLETAIKAVVNRHESLRTTIEVVDGVPYQKVNTPEALGFKLAYVDLSVGQSDQGVYDLMNESLEQPFDLESGPLFKATVYKTAEGEVIFFLAIHHIISDGWSRGVFENEIIANYTALSNGQPVETAPLTTSYKDYAAWQNNLLEKGQLDAQKAYWVDQLNGELPKLELPYKQERPAKQSFNGQTLVHQFSQDLTEKVEESIKENESTLFITLMAAVYLFFFKKTGQKDIIFGTAVAGRGKSELENLIGFFVNTLALRQEVNQELSFKAFHDAVKEMILDSFKNEEYPFDKLVDDLDLERDLSRSPIFDVLVEVHQFDELAEMNADTELESMPVQPIDVEERVSIYDLSYVFYRKDQHLELKLQYNTDLFEQQQALDFIAELESYLSMALQDSAAKLRDINLRSAEEIIQQLPYREGFYPEDISIVELVEQHIQAHGKKTAIQFGNRSVSYAELGEGVDRISNFLRAIPDAEGSIVGIMCERSPEMVMSILAAWKSGMAYIPLDGELPVNRLKFMAEDAGIRVLISGTKYLNKSNQLQWSAQSLDHFLCVDSKDIYNEEEPLNESMKKELWEYIGETATDEIEGGGWISSYTGKPIPKEEMAEYRENTYQKVKGFVNKESKVLEIGCASGITMFRVAPLVKKYVGTDLSSVILEKNAAIIEEKKISNIALANLYAHEIDQVAEQDFDLIIINSVIQNFNGLNYLRKVLKKCTNLLSDEGIIFVGDVMDLDQKEGLITSLKAFENENEGKGLQTKTVWEDELFVARRYFDDLRLDISGIAEVTHSEKIYTIENELSLFRYDTVLKYDRSLSQPAVEGRYKYQYDYKYIGQLEPVFNPSPIHAEDLAYVIYTSGSTGRPKGAGVRHLGMINHLYAKINDLQMDADSVIIQNASHSFDISVWQFFSCLLTGGKVSIYSNELVRDCEQFIRQVSTDQPTILQLVPSYLTEIFLIAQENQEIVWTKHLKYLVVTGEELTKNLAREWFERYQQIPLVNAYGPTEASDDITHFIMDELPTGERVSIGSPIQNTRIYILDESNKICPVGVKGEICVTGIAVGSGYINNQEKTAQAFIKNAVEEGSVYQIYKTGDIGKFNHDGTLEFYGRKDFQTKIRGYRIELGEIEHSLLKINDISEAVVLASKDAEGTTYLTGFYTLKEHQKITQDTIRATLAGTIPEYMIPSELYQVAAMPLNRNGKIDRKVLAGMAVAGSRKVKAPRNSKEEALLGLWKRILDKELISITDSFFEIGGHSLKATRLVSLIHKELNFKISLRDVFNHPTIEQMAEILQQDKQDAFDGIPQAGQKAHYPLSHAQKRIWVLSQIGEGAAAYTEHGGVEIHDALDVDQFGLAINALTDRHESLRTTFKVVDGAPVQVIHDQISASFEVGFEDLSDSVNQDEAVSAILKEREQIGFDLEKGPLFDPLLIQLAADRFIFLYSVHHIISDGWSGNVFLKDIDALYHQIAGVSEEVLPALNIHYKDFAEWQNGLIENGDFESHKAFWAQQLEGDIPVVDLPLYKRRPAVFTNQGGTQSFTFSKEFSAAINRCSRENEVSLFMSLVAVFNSLVNRYTALTDITLGTSIAGRENLNLENQIGFYLNTVALRNKIETGETFRSLLAKVKENTLNAMANQEYPFDMVIEDLKPRRDISRSPIFDILIELQNYVTAMEPSKSANQLSLKPLNMAKNVSQLDMNLSFFENGDELVLNIVYNNDIFEAHQIQTLVAHFELLAETLVANPDKPIADHPMLLEEEIQLLDQLNDNAVTTEESALLHQQIEQLALHQPEKVAVISKEATLTYGELNRRANQLARLIQAQLGDDAAGNSLIAILLDRSELTLITILAIWKCGHAYIPLDKEYPGERIKSILTEYGQVPLVVTELHGVDEELQQHLSQWSKVVFVDDLALQSAYTDVNLDVSIAEGELAYVIFTSGSTGKPKGAMVEHRGMMNHLYAKVDDLQLTNESIVAQTASLTFDISVWQMFVALLKGGTTVVYDKETILDPISFCERLTEDQVTILELVPSYLMALLDAIEAMNIQVFGQLSYLMVTGEIVKPETVNRWLDMFPGIPVVNAYGPTEASDDITHFIADKPIESERVPIGFPIRNTNIYILDEHLNQCPVGVKGEICVSGVGVGRGYLNDTEKTNSVFLNDPFVEGESRRMYKTGDFGRVLPNGVLEIFGRKDYQVKIKGHRIELGEIEAAMSSLELVKESVVKVFENHQDESFLCGFYVPDESDTTADTIKLGLTKLLPGYMIPGTLVELDSFPLTANGKVDRKALRKPEVAEEDSASPNERKSDLEKILSETWQSVLGLANVSLSDNFFDVGGDSINAIQIASDLYKKGYKMEVKDIFGAPILAEQALLLQTLKTPADQSAVTGEIPLTPIQKAFFDRVLVDQQHHNMSVMLHFKGEMETSAITAVFQELQQHHDALRITFHQQDDGVLQVNQSLDYPLAVDVTDAASESEILDHANKAQASLDLERGPLMKLIHFRTGTNDQLLIVVHHLIIDVFSWMILLEDIDRLLRQHLKGEPFELPLKTHSFKYWANQLQAESMKDSVNEALPYWRTVADQVASFIHPVSNGTADTYQDAKVISVELSEEDTSQLLEKANIPFNTNTTDLILSGMLAATHTQFGRPELSVMIESFGRDVAIRDANIKRTIGWFNQEHPVVLELVESGDRAHQIKSIKESLRKADSNSLAYNLLLLRDQLDAPIGQKPQIRFNYLGTVDDLNSEMLFDVSTRQVGALRSKNSNRAFDFEVTGKVEHGKLVLELTFNPHLFDASVIEKWWATCKAEIEKLVRFCAEYEQKELTPSDLSYDELSLDELDAIKGLFD